ncbi:transmembrane protein [Cystoisospora suis]|uniref:Transmembrane protein n=1 Tax=Cystoisospora suis TaxID=483139 RepID=A0A2C6KW01_9APIC|nr:transmembrane protein [Cystoisospora suis]
MECPDEDCPTPSGRFSLTSSFFSSSLESSEVDPDDLPPPSPLFSYSWAVHSSSPPSVFAASVESHNSHHGDTRSPLMNAPAFAVSPRSKTVPLSPPSSRNRLYVLSVCLVLMTFSSSLYRCVEPLQALMRRSSRFLVEEGLSSKDVEIVITNGFALSSGLGLLGGLFLSSLLAPFTSPKILGLLCIASAGCGLLLSAFAENTATMMVSIVLLGLTCAMTNAILPVVALFPYRAAEIYTLVCASDFASVLPLQLFRLFVEKLSWNPRSALTVYVGCVYPVLFLLVFLLPAWPFSLREDAPIFRQTITGEGDEEQNVPLLAGKDGDYNAHHGTRNDGEGQREHLDRRRASRTSSYKGNLADSPLRTRGKLSENGILLTCTQLPFLWNLSFGRQLCSAHLYGLSTWWLFSALGSESLRLFYRRVVLTESDADTLTAVAGWTGCLSCLVLPAIYTLHARYTRQRVQQSPYFTDDAEVFPGERKRGNAKEAKENSAGERNATLVKWSGERLLAWPQITPRGLASVASIMMAFIGILLLSGNFAASALAVALGCFLQALAPTAMFLVLANTYGPRYFSSLLSVQVLLLASVGLFAPLLQHVVFARLHLPGTALGYILLVCAIIGIIPLACFHCTPCDEFDGKQMRIAGTGLPLALEKHSMAALFAQAGVDPSLIK